MQMSSYRIRMLPHQVPVRTAINLSLVTLSVYGVPTRSGLLRMSNELLLGMSNELLYEATHSSYTRTCGHVSVPSIIAERSST